jgi:elongation factor Ts
MDCKKALTEASGDLEKAIDILRKRGIAKAQKKSGRSTKEGLILPYIHPGAKLGVLLEINCETDFVANTEDFKELSMDIAMHIAASNPICLDKEDVPEDLVSREKRIFLEQASSSGKPPEIIEKMVEGRMKKFFKEITLLGQSFIKDPDISIRDLLDKSEAKVQSFIRYEVGEGIEKKEENFADEVMKQIKGDS